MKKNKPGSSKGSAPSKNKTAGAGDADARSFDNFDDVGGPGLDSLMGAGKADAGHKKDGSAE
jgi:hypothetical protein